jgi:hypothetical protein
MPSTPPTWCERVSTFSSAVSAIATTGGLVVAIIAAIYVYDQIKVANQQLEVANGALKSPMANSKLQPLHNKSIQSSNRFIYANDSNVTGFTRR